MTKTEYADYLASDHWRRVRALALENMGLECNKCEMPRWLAEIAYDQDLHVCHITFSTLGSENINDLEVLCRRCHEIKEFGRSELREVKVAECEICAERHWDYRSRYCIPCQHLMHGSWFPLCWENPVEGEPFWKTLIFSLALCEFTMRQPTLDQILDYLAEKHDILSNRFTKHADRKKLVFSEARSGGA